ncbi:MAG: translation initiation factor IF-2 N-terminal domain-containing protein, partial [Selenomonadaceae bacterium]|nr:translation initiation factor IF-2 N-terminal domain-containing protein [Selenomonadaceae bacterium]
MAAKRIYQMAKEFERDEKEIIEFLIGQGIKVANRLSAVSEDTYNMLKVKYTAPPPPPEPEP